MSDYRTSSAVQVPANLVLNWVNSRLFEPGALAFLTASASFEHLPHWANGDLTESEVEAFFVIR